MGRHDVPTPIGGPRDCGTHPSRGHGSPIFRAIGRTRPLTLPTDDLRTAQISDPSCCNLHAQYEAHLSIDIDKNGRIGLVLPSGEFQLVVPPLPGVPLPLSLFTEIPCPDTDDVTGENDAPDLKGGVVLRNPCKGKGGARRGDETVS
jgi:hypothetical protein